MSYRQAPISTQAAWAPCSRERVLAIVWRAVLVSNQILNESFLQIYLQVGM